nr:ABC transporter ATP-binding protein [Lientehia hominis]
MQVLFDVSMEVKDGECVALVGSNGAGKTSLLNVVGGHLKASAGQVIWNGEDILKTSPTKRADLAISHIPQGRGILGTLSVMDNLLLGGYCRRVKKKRMENIEKAFDMFPKLKERQKQVAGSMSGGEQQMLAIARALVMEPDLLMLDEPSLGLAPVVVDEMFDYIAAVRDSGVSILLIEQNLPAALSIAQRGYVMENGRIVLEGNNHELAENEDVKRAYLGI